MINLELKIHPPVIAVVSVLLKPSQTRDFDSFGDLWYLQNYP